MQSLNTLKLALSRDELVLSLYEYGLWTEGLHIEQNAYEFADFALFCQAQNVRTFLELGTGRYAGLAKFCTWPLGWQVTAVDIRIPEGYLGDIEFIHADTEKALPLLQGRTFDAVLIDADKSHYGLLRDHAAYRQLARIVAIHDIAPGRGCCFEASNYWTWFKDNGGVTCYEAIADVEPIGIGWHLND